MISPISSILPKRLKQYPPCVNLKRCHRHTPTTAKIRLVVLSRFFNLADSYSIALYGSSAAAALYLANVVLGAVDSIPLFPKLMEVVGLGYSIWLANHYLLFKKNRVELAAKIEELKKKILGPDDE